MNNNFTNYGLIQVNIRRKKLPQGLKTSRTIVKIEK